MSILSFRSKYGSVKVTDTSANTVEGYVIEILEDATFTSLTEAGITSPLTVHGISGAQAAGEFIFAKTKFTGVQLSAGSIRVGGYPIKRAGGLANYIKNALILWLYGTTHRGSYIIDKAGSQDRELISGEIFPGRAYEGDGTNYIDTTSEIAFADNVAWAVSCFVEWDVIAQADSIFGNAYTASNYTRWTKVVAGTGYLFANDANDQAEWTFTIPTVRHHVLIQCDGANASNLELFIDGVSEGTKTMADTAITIIAFMHSGGGQNPLDGKIDDFRVYGRLLNSTEIAALQTKDALGGELLWYPCEDVNLFTAFDASGNENHGAKVSWLAGNHVEGAWRNLMNKYGYNKEVNGLDLVTNGDFASGTGWSVQGGWEVTGGKGVATATTGSMWQANILAQGRYYEITYTISDYSAGSLRIKCGINGLGTSRDANGTYTETLLCVDNEGLYFDGIVSFTGKVDNVSAREYFANEVPADLSGATARADINLMQSDKGDFAVDTESWTKYANNTITQGTEEGGTITTLQIAFNDDDRGAYVYFKASADLTTDLVTGIYCKLSMRMKVSGGAETVNADLHDGDAYVNDIFVLTTDYVWHEHTFKVGTDPSIVSMRFDNMGTGEVVHIEEWFIEQVIYAAAVPTVDVVGNALVFKNQAKYHGISVDAACIEGDGVMYLTVPGLLTTDTISVETGSDTPTCTLDDQLDIADGDIVYGVTITRAAATWAIFPMCEGAAAVIHDVSGNGNHGVGVSFDESNWTTQDLYHYLRDFGVSTETAKLNVSVCENGGGANGYTTFSAVGTDGFDVTSDGGGLHIAGTEDEIQITPGREFLIEFDMVINSGVKFDAARFASTLGGNTRSLNVLPAAGFNSFTLFALDYTEVCVFQFYHSSKACDLEIRNLVITAVDEVIPALADKSAAADGAELEYVGGSNAVPGTYFHLPADIGDLIAADQEVRYLNIMDDGKGIFTEDVDIVDSDKGNFDVDTESWAAYGGNTIEVDAGALKITHVDDGSGANLFLKDDNDLDTDLTVGAFYRLKYRAKDNGDGSQHLRVHNGTAVTEGDLLTTDFVDYDIVFVATSTDGCFIYCDANADGIIWIESYELIPQNTESWNVEGGSLFENVDGALKITANTDANGGYVNLRATSDINRNLTVGTDYRVSMKVKTDSGDSVNLQTIGSTSAAITLDTWIWITLDFTATHVSSNYIRGLNMAPGEVIYIAEYSVHEKITSVGQNLITDGEGHRWADDDSDGVGNGWLAAVGAGTHSIQPEGEGFTGNYQQIDHVTGTITRVQYSTGVNAISGQTYQVTGKFRAGVANWRIYLRGTVDPFTSNMGVNTGGAISFSYTIAAAATAEIVLSFYKHSGDASDYLEIDEIKVQPVIDLFFYEPAILGSAPIVLNTTDLIAYRYLVQYYNITSRKDLLLLEAGHDLDGGDHNTLLKFTKNEE